MKKVKVAELDGCSYVDFRILKDFQGDLKTISGDNIEKLKKSILRVGFVSPFFVWENHGSLSILDGHQRQKALYVLDREGYFIPDLPVVKIPAESIEQAREILIYQTSQYGEFNPEAASDWLDGLDDAVSELS